MDSRDEGMSGQEGQAEEAPEMESLSPKEHESEGASEPSHESLSVQKRLKQQQRAHERQMRELRSEMQSMREHSSASANPGGGNQPTNPYVPPGVEPGSVEEHIHRAVGHALNYREQEEQKAKNAESQQHIARGYQELNNHLDSMGDTHEDFDDVVRGDAPFTSHMRDTALLLPHKGAGSAGEVLYKLGKNPDELKRISRLHPKDQAAEMIRLSHALVGGEEKPRGESHNALGSIKSNPVTNSASITDKTSPGDIRRRMKAGTFK
jgi:hypothetical protein